MIPTVTQQLQALYRRLAETVLPAIPADEEFAQEQGQLILATLNWLMDTHEYEYRYEVVENTEYRSLLSELVHLDGLDEQLRAEARANLAEAGPREDEAATPLPDLADQSRRFKRLAVNAASDLLANSGAGAEAARPLVARAARIQGMRELAFFRTTGFSPENRELRAELRSDQSYASP